MGSNYTSLEAELHDAFWDSEETPELAWMDALLTQHPGPSLEVGSGSGRLLLPLLEKGHDIEGLEPSHSMNQLCREQAEQRDLSPTLHEGGMSDLATGSRYANILIPAFTLQLSEDPAADLKVLHQHLAPDGQLYLTVFLPFAEIDQELPENEWYRDHEITFDDGRVATLETRHRVDHDGQILRRDHLYRLTDGDEIREHESSQSIRWFTPVQLHQLLTDQGFEPDRAVADFDENEPVTDDSQIITVVARRI